MVSQQSPTFVYTRPQVWHTRTYLYIGTLVWYRCVDKNIVFEKSKCVRNYFSQFGRYDISTERLLAIIYIQGSPSGCGWCEIPGVTQVERGTQVIQVVKAYAGGNNDAWVAVLLYSSTVQCSTVIQYYRVQYSTVQYSSAVVYGTLIHCSVV